MKRSAHSILGKDYSLLLADSRGTMGGIARTRDIFLPVHHRLGGSLCYEHLFGNEADFLMAFLINPSPSPRHHLPIKSRERTTHMRTIRVRVNSRRAILHRSFRLSSQLHRHNNVCPLEELNLVKSPELVSVGVHCGSAPDTSGRSYSSPGECDGSMDADFYSPQI